ncbi:protein of unknown function [Pedobacter steynii]|uniref:DUF5013 domain-containing protein n=1 Tax=Pedobacter steynii TaxID=430522 RepID=A0A1G9V3Y7_9SPHI|nr:DUF4998 domain-containing protein [Pedobacter steynii]NQX40964.1 DUF5013 domain-containing protein [Pedobacter steynii]SDM66545.1 protein of unknown function [Pedobacter steynii]
MKNNILSRLFKQPRLLLLAMMTISLASCEKADKYKEFVKDGEISYIGKLDSVKVYSGKNRVMIKGMITSDPKIVECRVFWNNKKDSLVIPVTKEMIADTIHRFVNIATEGFQNFVIYTYDAAGNRSIPVNTSGRTYGSRYQAGLTNRDITAAKTDETTGITTVDWLGMDRLTGVFATDITYTKLNNQSATVRIPIDSSRIALKDFKYGSTINYKTLFLPDTISVDTFYSAVSTRQIVAPAFLKINVTNTYLKNAGGNFSRSSWDNSRWGLVADWTTSAGAKNVNNTYGSYEFRNGSGMISFEAGWGLPGITDALIYQTVSLPAGTYSFEANGLDQNAGGTRYIAVGAGSSLPLVANIPTAAIKYGILNPQPATATVKLEFTLTQTTQVSIGFAATMAANGYYTKIGNVRLYTIQNL